MLRSGATIDGNFFCAISAVSDLHTSNVRSARAARAAHARSQNRLKYCLRSSKQFLARFRSFLTCACPACAAHLSGMRRMRDHDIRFLRGLIPLHTDFQRIRTIS